MKKYFGEISFVYLYTMARDVPPRNFEYCNITVKKIKGNPPDFDIVNKIKGNPSNFENRKI